MSFAYLCDVALNNIYSLLSCSGAPVVYINGCPYLNQPPEVKVPPLDVVHLASVTHILISNFNTMAALPFITEYSDFRLPAMSILADYLHSDRLNYSAVKAMGFTLLRLSFLSLSYPQQWRDICNRTHNILWKAAPS